MFPRLLFTFIISGRSRTILRTPVYCPPQIAQYHVHLLLFTSAATFPISDPVAAVVNVPTFCLTPASLLAKHDLILHCYEGHIPPTGGNLLSCLHLFLFHLHWLFAPLVYFFSSYSLPFPTLPQKCPLSLVLKRKIPPAGKLSAEPPSKEGQVVLAAHTSSHGQLSMLHWTLKKPPQSHSG